jgi:hypothetical protein
MNKSCKKKTSIFYYHLNNFYFFWLNGNEILRAIFFLNSLKSCLKQEKFGSSVLKIK